MLARLLLATKALATSDCKLRNHSGVLTWALLELSPTSLMALERKTNFSLVFSSRLCYSSSFFSIRGMMSSCLRIDSTSLQSFEPPFFSVHKISDKKYEQGREERFHLFYFKKYFAFVPVNKILRNKNWKWKVQRWQFLQVHCWLVLLPVNGERAGKVSLPR